jgi:hypothetical protein
VKPLRSQVSALPEEFVKDSQGDVHRGTRSGERSACPVAWVLRRLGGAIPDREVIPFRYQPDKLQRTCYHIAAKCTQTPQVDASQARSLPPAVDRTGWTSVDLDP